MKDCGVDRQGAANQEWGVLLLRDMSISRRGVESAVPNMAERSVLKRPTCQLTPAAIPHLPHRNPAGGYYFTEGSGCRAGADTLTDTAGAWWGWDGTRMAQIPDPIIVPLHLAPGGLSKEFYQDF